MISTILVSLFIKPYLPYIQTCAKRVFQIEIVFQINVFGFVLAIIQYDVVCHVEK